MQLYEAEARDSTVRGAACAGRDLVAMEDITPANVDAVLPKLEGGAAGRCSRCILANKDKGFGFLK